MSKSLFLLKVLIDRKEKITIRAIGEFTHEFLCGVMKFDNDPNTFSFVNNNNKREPLSINTQSREIEIEDLAGRILNYNKRDIAENDHIKNPTIEFSRDWGFSFLITWNKSGKEILCFHFNMGALHHDYIGTMSFSMDYEQDFQWYYTTLQKLVGLTGALTASVYFKVSVFKGERPQVIIEPGWITYFSDRTSLQLPELTSVETDRSDNGVYLIATREDITQSKEYYEMIKIRVSDLHQELIARVPGYVIQENQ